MGRQATASRSVTCLTAAWPYLLLLLQLLLLGVGQLCDAHQAHGLPLLVAEPLEVLNWKQDTD